MHILILGAGALGSLFGARLSQTEAKVSLLTTNKRHVQSIRQSGLTIEELDGGKQCYALSAYDDALFMEETPDLVIVAVKTYDIEEAVAGIADHCSSNTTFLTLQNGIGNWERIGRLVGRGLVLVGTTAQGATLVEPGLIRHGGNGPTFIGEPQGPPSSRVLSVVNLFQRAGFKTEARDGMEHLIWEKLHANVGINAITALTGIRNGFVAENAVARELCSTAVKEAMVVARAKGFEIDAEMPKRVLTIARSTAVNRSSMGQDADRRKRTEIDSINGAIVTFGEQAHIPTPVNQTLTQLVKIMEAGYLKTQAGPSVFSGTDPAPLGESSCGSCGSE
jgi:2-dehydropantoate 2-reductase